MSVVREWRNWADTQRAVPAKVAVPRSVGELRAVLVEARKSGLTVKVVGSGHSPNDIARPEDVMVSLREISRVLEVDQSARTAVVEAGATLYELNARLSAENMALSSLGSISQQTVGGAIATATHGSGLRYGSLSSELVWLEIMDSEGQVARCSENERPELFAAAAVGIGCLGVVTCVCIRCEPAFRLREVVTVSDLDEVLRDVPALAASADHCRFNWVPHTGQVAVVRLDRTDLPAEPAPRSWFRERLVGHWALESALLVSTVVPALVPAINRAFGGAMVLRESSRVVDSAAAFNFDCLFKQYVDEWCIPLDRCAEALRRLRRAIDEQGHRVHFPVEVRFSRAESSWLSPAHGRPSCYVGVIMYRPHGREPHDHLAYFRAYEAIMRDLGGRPHWGKCFELQEGDLRSMYPHWDDFVRVRGQMDPHRLFENSFTRRLFHAVSASTSPSGPEVAPNPKSRL